MPSNRKLKNSRKQKYDFFYMDVWGTKHSDTRKTNWNIKNNKTKNRDSATV